MSTFITVSSGTADLVSRVKEVQRHNRQAQLQQASDGTMQAILNSAIAKQADLLEVPNGGNPDTTIDRRPAAHRNLSYRFFAVNWAALAYSRSVVLTHQQNVVRTYQYTVPDQISLQIGRLLPSAAGPGSKISWNEPGFVLPTPSRLFTSDYTEGLSYYNVITVAKPVYSYASGYGYLLQRITYSRINPRWAGGLGAIFEGNWSANNPYNFSLDFSSPNGQDLISHFCFFKVNLASGQAEAKRIVVTKHIEHNTGLFTTNDHEDGEPKWIETYVNNAYPGDPSIEARKLGYSKDYIVNGNTARFLRVRSFSGQDPIYNPLELYPNLRDQGSELYALTFPISYASTAELVAELNDCFNYQFFQQRSFVARKFLNGGQVNSYSATAKAIWDEIYPPGTEPDYYAPTAPYVYPMAAL